MDCAPKPHAFSFSVGLIRLRFSTADCLETSEHSICARVVAPHLLNCFIAQREASNRFFILHDGDSASHLSYPMRDACCKPVARGDQFQTTWGARNDSSLFFRQLSHWSLSNVVAACNGRSRGQPGHGRIRSASEIAVNFAWAADGQFIAAYFTYHANIHAWLLSLLSTDVESKRSKMRWRLRLRPDPAAGAYSAPRTPAGLRGRGGGRKKEERYEKGEGRGRWEKIGKGQRREKEGKGKGEKGRGNGQIALTASVNLLCSHFNITWKPSRSDVHFRTFLSSYHFLVVLAVGLMTIT